MGDIASKGDRWGVDCTHVVLARTPTRWVLDTDSIERRFAPTWSGFLRVHAVVHEPRHRAWDRILRNADIDSLRFIEK